jgi:hypothetical protein
VDEVIAKITEEVLAKKQPKAKSPRTVTQAGPRTASQPTAQSQVPSARESGATSKHYPAPSYVPADEREAIRLANDKYEIFYAPGSKVRESVLPNGKVTECRTTKPFGKMLKL